MASVVYILCGLTSIACAVLLFLAYFASKRSLLLWSGFCFVGLALNNIFMIEDLLFAPGVDFSVPRNLSGAIGTAFLLYGLLWKQTAREDEET